MSTIETRQERRQLSRLMLTTGTLLLGVMGLSIYQRDAIAIESQTVTIQFAGMVTDTPFACGQTYISSASK